MIRQYTVYLEHDEGQEKIVVRCEELVRGDIENAVHDSADWLDDVLYPAVEAAGKSSSWVIDFEVFKVEDMIVEDDTDDRFRHQLKFNGGNPVCICGWVPEYLHAIPKTDKFFVDQYRGHIDWEFYCASSNLIAWMDLDHMYEPPLQGTFNESRAEEVTLRWQRVREALWALHPEWKDRNPT